MIRHLKKNEELPDMLLDVSESCKIRGVTSV